MIKTLRESKAKLSELVEQASRGEDVLITVRGKVKARLTQAAEPFDESGRAAWLRELRKLRRRYAPATGLSSSDDILAEIREER
ncbi:MAG: type II toxin-antitoxin system prevent-host-death family antitoxin [Acidobacteria bacterium]|nr:type II toxin-antitoxin system prevent-host-death family antitoxin [Acidobacteriota bacterium]